MLPSRETNQTLGPLALLDLEGQWGQGRSNQHQQDPWALRGPEVPEDREQLMQRPWHPLALPDPEAPDLLADLVPLPVPVGLSPLLDRDRPEGLVVPAVP